MFFLLFLFTSLISGIIGTEVRISSVDEFIRFKDNVNNGVTYSGTTVLLDSDLSLAGKAFEPIGNSYLRYFLGTFDGKGHVISNLVMNSSSEYVGLFGYSKGLIIRNVVFDSSCSVMNSYKNFDGYAYAGGIIGYCRADSRPCTIENNVNMGSVSFAGNISNKNCYLFLGGIAGDIYSPNYDSAVKNCANYGDVAHSGFSDCSHIGGVVGESSGDSPKVHILNSLNYGTITHNGTSSSELIIGGISGFASAVNVENCVSAGKISILSEAEEDNYIGSIIGYVELDASINYFYITSELSDYDKCGYTENALLCELGTFDYDSATFKLDETVSVGSYTGTYLIEALNAAADYYTLRYYSHWLLNKNSNDVTFTINETSASISMNYQVMLLPSLANEGNMSFYGWYKDSAFTTPLASYVITSITTLYGKWEKNTNSYTITFDTKREGVTVAPITTQFNSFVTLPSDSIREHCSIAFWETVCGENIGLSLTMPAHDVTLYAVWKCTRIRTPEDLVDFSRVVNSGADTFDETTVLLDSDLSLAGKTFDPIGYIGNSGYNYFLGVFDGQGHVISNLEVNSSSRVVGLFGFSIGATIRNVILDSSCSITSSFSSDDVFVGEFIGDCISWNGPCTIENSVNMGSVSFTEDISNFELYLGGIAGYFDSGPGFIKNCVNYGDVTHSGESESSYIGGIVGSSWGGLAFMRTYICNSINYGTITHSGESENLCIGGIAGKTEGVNVENCVSAGKILLLSETREDKYIGSIIGYVEFDTSINYCYATSELDDYKKYYYRYSAPSESYVLSYDSTTFELNGTVSIGDYTGTSPVDALNAAADYYTLREYSHWLFNKKKNAVSFTINGKTSPIKMNYQIMVLPSLASEGSMIFDGWYKDSAYAVPLTSYEVTGDTELYGKWEVNPNSYTITFDTRREGVTIAPITTQFGSVVTLPSDSIREHCSVGFWETKYGDYFENSLTMPAYDITLYAVWKCTRIKTPEDFTDFSRIVNSDIDTFEETTVFLDSDLSLAGKAFEPIGTDSNYFLGVFDGQGHVISNLGVNSSSQYVGLFGLSRGLTIRNVILDSSCSIAGSLSFDDVFVGGIIGKCFTMDRPCVIENSVNMGSVSFTLDEIYYLYLGGIAGYIDSSEYGITLKNCANYGDVTDSGESHNSFIGGIVGESYGDSSNNVNIYNCINYGTIAHSNTTSWSLYLGGISGNTKFTTIENCVSAGKIKCTETASYNYIGSIIGYIESDMTISYCYIASELSSYSKYSDGTPSTESNVTSYDSATFEINETISIGEYTGTSLIEALNAYTGYYTGYSRWLLNKDNSTVLFIINGRTAPIEMSYQIILLPSLASEGIVSFDGWYEDSDYTTPLTSYEVADDTTFYGIYGFMLTVTFDANGGENISFVSKKVIFNDIYGELPEAKKTEHTLAGWFTERTGGDEVKPNSIVTINSDHTLYAHWTVNKYTITFDFGNDTTSSVVLDFNATIEYPEDIVEREGFNFTGWEPRPERMPAHDLNVTAQWSPLEGKGKSSTKAALIIGITVPIGVIIVAVVIAVLVISFYRKKKSGAGPNAKVLEASKPLINHDDASV